MRRGFLQRGPNYLRASPSQAGRNVEGAADFLPYIECHQGTDFKMGFGGKGANQAVAAASALYRHYSRLIDRT